MHQKFSAIISIVLIMAVLAMGLPHFMAGDLNNNNRADLADAIIGVSDFSKTAAKPQEFIPKVKNAIIALNSLAGISTQIKAENDTNLFPALDNFFLIPQYTVLICLSIYTMLFEMAKKYKSITPLPSIPPPEI